MGLLMKDDEIGHIAIRVIDTLAEFTLIEQMANDGKITEEDFKKYCKDLPEAESKIIDSFQEKRYQNLKFLLARQENRD